jgi:hypothetical protein
MQKLALKLTMFVLFALIFCCYILLDPPMWTYWFGMAIAADQVRVKVYYAANEYQYYSLYMTTAFLSVFYLPPQEAWMALASVGLVTSLFEQQQLIKKVFNTALHIFATFGLVVGYTLSTNFLHYAVWPSLEAFLSMLFGLVIYESISTAMFSTVTDNAIRGTLRTWMFPVGSALLATTLGLLIELNTLWIPALAGLTITLLRPTYHLPLLRSPRVEN